MEPILFLSLLWLAYWLSDFLLNGRWWVWEFTSMIPSVLWPIFWIGLLSLGIVAQSPVSILIVLCTFPFVYQVTDINLWNHQSGKALTAGLPVRLFNWNTLYWTEQPKPDFYEFLKSQDADVYHLQEAIHRRDVAIDVVPELQSHFPGYHIVQSGELVTMTRLPVVAKFIDPTKSYLRLDLEISGQKVSFYNVHITVHIAPEHLQESVQLFLQKVKERFSLRQQEYQQLWEDLEHNALPKVISGDFNTAKSQKEIHRFLHKYQDSFSVLHRGIPRTFAFAKKIKLWRIDYVFATHDIQFLQNDFVNPSRLSDHVGSTVELVPRSKV